MSNLDPNAVLPDVADQVFGTPPTVGMQVVRKNTSVARDSATSNGMDYEDEFTGKYSGIVAGTTIHILEPPYAMKTLEGLIQHNNALQPCIDAMVTNVHGTGCTIQYKTTKEEETAEDKTDTKLEEVKAFFDEVFPGVSFKQLRKLIGRDREVFGNAYVEVIRNLRGEMIMLRRLDPKLVRLVRLSDPLEVDMMLRRGGKEFKTKTVVRFRRFVQSVGSDFVFFKEYGCPQEIDKKSGTLYDKGDKIRLFREKKLGSEIIWLPKVPDVETSYGVPVWAPQMPSVLGSRKAEEHNLDYFDSGGVPPFMVFVHGGQMAPKAAEDLRNYMSSKPNAKQGVPVFEAYSTGGNLDGGGGSVRITVERFGQERQKDAMFESYDKNSEMKIRRAWRLPPLFVGGTEDYTFATAYASYTTAEAQVFAPEREEFDAWVNSTIMRELNPEGDIIYRSMPMTVQDVEKQLTGLELAAGQRAVSPTELVRNINGIVSLDLKVADGADEQWKETGDNLAKAPQLQAETAIAVAGTRAAAAPKPGAGGKVVGKEKPKAKPQPAKLPAGKS